MLLSSSLQFSLMKMKYTQLFCHNFRTVLYFSKKTTLLFMDSANLHVEKQQEATREARALQLPKKGGKLFNLLHCIAARENLPRLVALSNLSEFMVIFFSTALLGTPLVIYNINL